VRAFWNENFRAVLRCFARDLPALTAAKTCGVNKNTTHRLYGLLRQRVAALAEAEARPFVGGIVEIDDLASMHPCVRHFI
jgi:hypothetical protein